MKELEGKVLLNFPKELKVVAGQTVLLAQTIQLVMKGSRFFQFLREIKMEGEVREEEAMLLLLPGDGFPFILSLSPLLRKEKLGLSMVLKEPNTPRKVRLEVFEDSKEKERKKRFLIFTKTRKISTPTHVYCLRIGTEEEFSQRKKRIMELTYTPSKGEVQLKLADLFKEKQQVELFTLLSHWINALLSFTEASLQGTTLLKALEFVSPSLAREALQAQIDSLEPIRRRFLGVSETLGKMLLESSWAKEVQTS